MWTRDQSGRGCCSKRAGKSRNVVVQDHDREQSRQVTHTCHLFMGHSDCLMIVNRYENDKLGPRVDKEQVTCRTLGLRGKVDRFRHLGRHIYSYFAVSLGDG